MKAWICGLLRCVFWVIQIGWFIVACLVYQWITGVPVLIDDTADYVIINGEYLPTMTLLAENKAKIFAILLSVAIVVVSFVLVIAIGRLRRNIRKDENEVVHMSYNIDRFKQAQEREYDIALAEIRSGRKESHWIWYIFPQLAALGYSDMAKFYGIQDIGEAKAYIQDPILRGRLLEISEALLALSTSDADEVMGSPDDLKLCSCMTLFREASPEEKVFQRVLDKYYNGEADQNTMALLRQ